MRLWSGLGLLAFLQAVRASNYKIEAFSTKVSAGDVRGIENVRSAFLPFEKTIETSLESVIPLDEFFIQKFKIHDHSPMQTVTYTAYFTSSFSRTHILEQIEGCLHSIFLSLIEIADDLPKPPSMFASQLDSNSTKLCYNEGVMLPNSECHCQAFYDGESCENLRCQHYGIEFGGVCNCPPGIYGTACESKGCMPIVADTINDNMKSLTFVFNQVPDLAYTLNEVVLKFQKLLNSGVTYQSYILTYYIRNEYLTSILTFVTEDKQQFLEEIANLVLIRVNPDDPNQEHLMAITQSQQNGLDIRGLSPIYVFATYGDVNGTMPDYHFNTPTVETNAILTTISWRNRVLFVYTLRDGELDVYDTEHDSIRRFTKAVLGDLIFIQPSEIDDIMDKFAPVYTYNEVSAARYYISNFQEEEEIALDGKESLLITTDPNGQLPTLTDNNGNEVHFTAKGASYLLLSTAALTGLKTITVKASSPWSYKKIHSDYSVTALLTFIDDKTMDVGAQFFTSESVKYATGLQLGVSGQSVLSMYDLDSGNTVTSSLTSYDRPGCSFGLSFYLAGFKCQPGPLGAQILTPSNGVNYIRIVPVLCAAIDHIPTPPFVCQNNGTLNDDGQSCRCATYYSGDHCEVAQCQNGGTPLAYSSTPCSCPSGYSGPVCAEVQCSSKSTDSFDYSSKTLAVVIQNSFSQNTVGSKIQTGIHAMLLSIPTTDAYTDYIITTFNMNGFTNDTKISKSKYSNSTLFEFMLADISYHPSTSVQQSSLTALYSTVEEVRPRSSIYLFVDAGPTDEPIFELEKAIIEKQIQLNIVITPPFNMEEQCMSPSDRGIYARLSQITGGTIMNLCNPYTPIGKDPIVQLLSTAGSVTHRVENIQMTYSPNCTMIVQFAPSTTPSEIYVFVNSDITDQFNVEYKDRLIEESFIPLTPLELIPFVGFYQFTLKNQSVFGFELIVEPKVGTPVGECTLRIAEISSFSSTLSFVPNPSYDSTGRSPTFGIPQNPVLHLSSVFQVDPIVYLQFFDTTGAEIFGYQGKLRDECNYEYYFPEFACPELLNDFTSTLSISAGNVQYQRSNRAFCYLQETQCLNGGTFNNDTKRCQCTNQFQGSRCERPICQNNGQPTIFFSCSCPDGYSGQFCEYISCPNPDYVKRADLQTSGYRQVVFAINLHRSQLPVYIYLKSIIRDFTFANFFNLAAPVQYSLITFTKTDVTNVISTLQVQRFIDVFQSLSHSFTDTSDGSTKVADALLNAYSIIERTPAQIFLFTGFDSTAPSTSLKTFASLQIEGTVNIFFTPPDQSIPYPKTLAMFVPPKTTGGRLMKLGPYDAQSILDLLSTSMIENGLIIDDAHDDCSGGYQFYFDLEGEAQNLILTISAPGIQTSNVEIKDESNKVISMNKGYVVMFSNDDNLVLSLNNTANEMAGQWKIKITSASYCNLQVRVVSLIDVYNGFANSISLDFVKQSPYTPYGKNGTAYMAFRSSGYLTNLELFDSDVYYPYQGTDGEKLKEVALIHQRHSSCSYQYISNEILFDSTSYQKLVVYGNDQNNNKFQRTFPLNMIKSSTPQDTCKFGTRDDTGFCTCDKQHTGSMCSDRICQNGGTPSSGICVCTAVFYGDYCELYVEQLEPASSTPASTVTGTTVTSTIHSTSASTVTPISTSTPVTTVTSTLASTSTIASTSAKTATPASSSTPVSTVTLTTASTSANTATSISTSTPVTTVTSTLASTSTVASTSANTATSISTSTPVTTGTSTLASTSANTATSASSSTPVSTVTLTTASTSVNTATSISTSTPVTTVTSTLASTSTVASTSANTATSISTSTPVTTGTSTVSSTSANTATSASSSTPLSTVTSTTASTSANTATSISTSTPVTTVTSTLASTSANTATSISTSTPVATGTSTLASTSANTATSASSSTPVSTVTSTIASTSANTATSISTSTPVATVTSTTGSTPTVTCPTETPFFLNIFVDIAVVSGQLYNNGQANVTNNIASGIKFGSENLKTKFRITGVGNGDQPLLAPSNVIDVQKAVDEINQLESDSYDLISTIDKYFKNNDNEHDDTQKPVAIIMASYFYRDPDTKDQLEEAITKLKTNNFTVLGTIDSIENNQSALCTLVGMENCFNMGLGPFDKVNDVTMGIMNKLCAAN